MLRARTLTSSSAPDSWPDALMRIASRATAGTGTGVPMVKVGSAADRPERLDDGADQDDHRPADDTAVLGPSLEDQRLRHAGPYQVKLPKFRSSS
jgi:hypothetical protein